MPVPPALISFELITLPTCCGGPCISYVYYGTGKITALDSSFMAIVSIAEAIFPDLGVDAERERGKKKVSYFRW